MRGIILTAIAWSIVAAIITACDASAERDAAPVTTPSAPPSSPGPADADLGRRAEMFESSTFHAEYDISIALPGFQADGTFAWYQAPGKARGDFRGTVNGEDAEMTLIPGDGYPEERFVFLCDPVVKSCTQWKPEDDEVAPSAGYYAVLVASFYTGAQEWSETVRVVSSRDKAIVAQQVRCFIAAEAYPEPGDLDHTGEMCVTEDGIALSSDVSFVRH